MAVTGAIFKALTFNGESSRSYGVYITGQAVYNAPSRDVEMITIPGRNGSFPLDHGRYENIEVTYPAGVFADTEQDFAELISDFRNMLCSANGYCRLEDEYNPDEYRMAVYKSGLEVDPTLLKAGEFEITFECKPQRYLKSGEVPVTMGEWADVETHTGNPIILNTDKEVKNLDVELLPIQEGTPRHDSTVYNEPYLTKTSPSYNSEYDKIIGGTVAWNQLLPTASVNHSGTDFTIVSNNDGEFTITATATTSSDSYNLLAMGTGRFTANHKYAILCDDSRIKLYLKGYGKWSNDIINVTTPTYTNISFEFTDLPAGTYKVHPMVIDLTQMFGSTIADYIYSLETATAGAGVAWFKKLFPKDYYPYNAGELMSVKTSAHVTSETYPLAGIELRGIPKLNTDKMYYDGDTYEDDGTVTRKYIDVGLSTLSWSIQSAGVYKAILPNAKFVNNVNAITDAPYTYLKDSETSYNKIFKIVISSPYVMIYFRNEDVSTLDAFKATVNGKTLIYEASTPTTETVTGFASPQAVGSTESYTDTRAVPIPVGHESRYADIFPITGHDSVTVTDTDGDNTNTTTVTLPHTVYGAGVGVTSGEGKETWANIPSYNGETITEPWLSSMDEYVQGTTPTTGAQVTYKLATPTDLSTTPTSLTLYNGDNVISSDGDMTLEIGELISGVDNPTRFEASPELQIKGYGTVAFNGYQVEIPDAVYGEVSLVEGAHKAYGMPITLGSDEYATSGDTITVRANMPLFLRAGRSGSTFKSGTIHTSPSKGTPSFTIIDSFNSRIEVDGVTFTFSKGTSNTASITVAYDITIKVENRPESTHTTTVVYSASYNATDDTIEMTFTASVSPTTIYFTTNRSASRPTTNASVYGSKSVLGDPTIIDCENGEVYKEESDKIVPLNPYIDLGAELPKLATGENAITTTGNITECVIIPRWWKL